MDTSDEATSPEPSVVVSDELDQKNQRQRRTFKTATHESSKRIQVGRRQEPSNTSRIIKGYRKRSGRSSLVQDAPSRISDYAEEDGEYQPTEVCQQNPAWASHI
jgi:hypothetical protein